MTHTERTQHDVNAESQTPGDETLAIREVPIPERLGTAAAIPFEKSIEFLGMIEESIWGNRDTWLGPESSLPDHRPSPFSRRVPLAAWNGDAVVGRAVVDYELDASAITASVWVATDPALRGRGLGSRMLAETERIAVDAGRRVLNSYSDHPLASVNAVDPEVPRLSASVGDAVIPETDPSARFAMKHGYVLAQVERVSVFELAHGEKGVPAIQETLARAVQRAGDGYELLTWGSETPEEHLDSYAEAISHMMTDIPAADLVVDATPWTRERVREREDDASEAGMELLRAAVRERSSGRIAAYSELELPSEHPHLAFQGDTLVLSAHRGHGLGMLMKAANLLSLAEVAPLRRRVYTWNADENAHMLRINTELGFEAIGYSAAWQKTVD